MSKVFFVPSIVAICVVLTSSASADLKAYRFYKLANPALELKGTVESTFQQKLDPTDPSNKTTFAQRAFINSDYAQGLTSPVLYVMCGEGSCDNGGFSGAVIAHAQKNHARLVALEHRYYGMSQPFAQLTADNLKYLTTENALADMAAFEDYLVKKNHWTGQWFAVGGSYSGSLAAYFRLKYPSKISGALASSGPVEAKASFDDYDADVTAAAGPACADAIRAVVKQVEATLGNPTQLAQMKTLFGGPAIVDNTDFLYTLADMAATAVQYGHKDEFCQALLGAKDPLTAYAVTGQQLLGITPLEDSFQGAESTDVTQYETGVGGRQWLWQSCTEYGYFQVANADPTKSTRSSLITLDFHYQMCKKLFGIDQPVNTDVINTEFYQPLMDPQQPGASQILFTDGSTDPWQYLSITKERGNDTNPLMSYLTIAGGSHCSDLGSSTATPVVAAQQQFETLLAQWRTR